MSNKAELVQRAREEAWRRWGYGNTTHFFGYAEYRLYRGKMQFCVGIEERIGFMSYKTHTRIYGWGDDFISAFCKATYRGYGTVALSEGERAK